jgi:hypothetical protein
MTVLAFLTERAVVKKILALRTASMRRRDNCNSSRRL